MDEMLKIPERRRGMPVWRLCLIMALTVLLLIAGAPMLFAIIRPV